MLLISFLRKGVTALTQGFSVFPNYLEAIQHFPEEQQAKICLALVKYGINEELPDPTVDPVSFGMISAWKLGLDNSIQRHAGGKDNGKKGGRQDKADYSRIGEMKASGMSSEQIANELGVSSSTIRSRPEWKTN